ncbi:lymphocyte antigen 6H-like [Manis pentadactyla]|uniref:lymphocyte antigen 6H-like n=1 Tax=Manis pentadactyla TaxID=143292 RepID=UPI00255CFB82|nr:lymphocyte antigen 6H-like [Manis pentadactyla]
MRGIRLVLLAILLSLEHALSLQCYSCSGIKDSGECQHITCSGVCFTSDMTMTVGNERIELQSKGCSPSCGLVSELLKQLVDSSTLDTGLLPGKLEVQDTTCCEKDFCNRVACMARSPWDLAGGLLLSLGPALWALL